MRDKLLPDRILFTVLVVIMIVLSLSATTGAISFNFMYALLIPFLISAFNLIIFEEGS